MLINALFAGYQDFNGVIHPGLLMCPTLALAFNPSPNPNPNPNPSPTPSPETTDPNPDPTQAR